MNPRRLIEFSATPTGRFLGFLLVGALVLATARGCKNRAPAEGPQPRSVAPADFLAESASRKTTPFRPAPPPPEAKPPPVVVKTAAVDRLPPIRVWSTLGLDSVDTPTDYAPFGRLIRCELVITVDSANITTPILGLVLEDVWHSGRLVIPVGAEVHGRAQLNRSRERIASQGTWTVVLPSGQELIVSGIALDHAPRSDGSGWDIRDGSAGLRGEVLKSDNLAEIKLFASAALAAAADSLKQNQQTAYGLLALPTAKNAALSGVSQVLTTYAQQIHEAIEREGIFVRFPAGKQFYLYVTETIDLAKARVAATRAHPETRADTTTAEGRQTPQMLPIVPALPVSSTISLHP